MLRVFFVILIFGCMAEAEAEVKLTVTAETEDFTGFSFKCSTDGVEDQQITSIVIYRQSFARGHARPARRERVAHISSVEHETVYPGPGFVNIIVEGEIGLEEESEAFLKVMLPEPRVEDLGLYTCEVKSVDNENHVSVFTAKAKLAAKIETPHGYETHSPEQTVTPAPEEPTREPEETTTLPEDTTTMLEQITTVLDETTTVPEETTTVPEEATTITEEITTVPEETTTVPGETTTLPGEITTVPEETTVVLDETTTVLDETTTVPEETTAAPAETATQVDETTTVPEETTTVPEETTTVPDEATTVLEETTTVPEETTTIPEETTTILDETTTVPEETTTVSAETTSSEEHTTTVAASQVKNFFIHDNASYFFMKPKEFTDVNRAKAECEDMRLYLTKVNDAGELQAIADEISPHILDDALVLIAGEKKSGQDVWLYQGSEEQVDFFAWGLEPPRVTVEDECLALRKTDQGVEMVAVPCTTPQTNFYFLCEDDYAQ